MDYSEIMVRYGELSTKGKNKRKFIMRLAQNVKYALSAFPEVKIHANNDRMHLLLNGEDSAKVITTLTPIFGIQSLSPSVKTSRDLDDIYATGIEMVKELYREGLTFKVTTKRSDHSYAYDSIFLNREIGHAIVTAIPSLQVQMKQPDINLRVEIRHDGAFLSCQTLYGAGGLPVGSSGKAQLMLSGGIDSPVAGYLSMKRGVQIEAVHFHSPPYTSQNALHKAKELTSKLASYCGSIKFITVPFTDIQEKIKKEIPMGYHMTLNRRFMLRITDRLREERKGLAIINGESLGQVASQTLQSMIAINDVTTTPIIRPVVSMDKLDIIKIAEEIDTYDLAIQPFEDCCTVFAPPQPKTKPDLEKTRRYESFLDVETLVEKAVKESTVVEIFPNQLFLSSSKEDFSDFL